MAQKRKDSRGRNLWTGESERKDGRYVYQYKDVDGSSRSIYGRTLEELREKEKRIQQDIQDGIRTDKGIMTFNELFQEYLALKKNEIKDSTVMLYKNVHRLYIENSSIGKKKISSIKNKDVKEFLYSIKKSKSTVTFVHRILSACLKYATENDYVRKNVASGVTIRVGDKKAEKTPLTESQVNKLIVFCKNSTVYSKHALMLTIAVNTGLRFGELSGLTWSDIDFNNKRLTVSRQLKYMNYGDGCSYRISSLKTDASNRTIALSEGTVTALRELKKYYFQIGVMCKTVIDGIGDFVFLTDAGTPYVASGFNDILYRMQKAYNKSEIEQAKKEKRDPDLLPHISAHILRHTAATILFEKGVNGKAVQGILGHSTIVTTMNCYTHAERDIAFIEREIEKVGGVANW